MAKETTAFKTGMTVLRGGNVPAYTLEYLTPGKRKQIGEFVTIVVPYAEMGRGNNCNIQYGDDYPTVSRKHAAIERRGSEYYLIHLSKTNPTLINGQPISKETIIRNGDEIQLSIEGPRLRFNATATGTASMGFTKKISLVTKQAIKPYRTLAYSLLGLIIIISATGGWFIFKEHKNILLTTTQLEEQKKLREQDSLRNVEYSKATAQLISELEAKNQKSSGVIDSLGKAIRNLPKPSSNPPALIPGSEFYQQFQGEVYYLECTELTITLPDGSYGVIPGYWAGTSFLCSDGKLVTARHCIQGWRYPSSQMDMDINQVENNGGKVNAKFRATSQSNWFEFNYSDVILDDSKDELLEQIVYDTLSTKTEIAEEGRRGKKTGTKVQYKFTLVPRSVYYKINDPKSMYTDWAYLQTDRISKLEYDKDLSKNLSAGDKVYILGFSLLKGGPQQGKVTPLFSESNVGVDGLQNGTILLTSRAIESGNSGGPVFVIRRNTEPKCIGIVSSVPLKGGSSTTLLNIVPIGNLK
jgi:hypothetical protein